ncbi:MAG: pirin family protein [Ignavibacteriaceae bacterium]|nr:pirin family protein [Ignavibacteriaceae bacterium]
MENMVFHKAETRGHEDHGWLNTYHNFSFAQYFAADRMQFGTLRVLNDDTVAAGSGFGRHPHNNMEIISIPLSGELEHKDSMNNTQVIKTGDIQVMSAGTGIFHSEFNRNKDKEVKFLQIWVIPNKIDVQPRYDQVTLDPSKRINQLQLIVSPNPQDEGVCWIYQDAWFYLGKIQNDRHVNYLVKRKSNGVFCFLLNGEMKIHNNLLQKRDAIGLWDLESIDIVSLSDDSEILVMDVPMKNSI